MIATARSIVRLVVRASILGSSLVLCLSACGSGATPASAPPAPETPAPATSLAPSSLDPTPTESSTSDPTPDDGGSTPTEDSTVGPTDDGTPKPPVLDKESSGRDLTLVDFFSHSSDWKDGRFNVAGQQNLAGVSGDLYNCYSDVPPNPATVELRLANNFSSIEMKVGQDDNSSTSDSVITVRLIGNGTYRDEVRVPFNKLVPFSASVAGVNALKIQFWKSGVSCVSGDVGIVLTQLRVE